VLVGALACPHPPLLFPGMTGSIDMAADLRTACREGIEALVASQPGAVVLVGGAGHTGQWDPGLPRGAGRFSARRVPASAAADAAQVLPLSLAVGQELLDAAGWPGRRELISVADDASPQECLALGAELARSHRRLALLALGDGSARRGLKAPGYLDERAARYDEQAHRGLAGDLAALRSLDARLGAELLAAGRAPWQVLAGAAAAGPAIQARIRYAGDPFGVYYVVAEWAASPA
jgi:hypothetical protein